MVAHGVGEAKPVAIIGVILDPGLVDPVDNLTQGEGVAGRELGKKKDALVLVDNGVAQQAGLGPARTEADYVTEGGIEDNAGDFRLGRLVVGQIFTPEKAGVDPAQGFAFWRAENVLGEARFDFVELLEGMEIPDEATTVFALHVAKGGV